LYSYVDKALQAARPAPQGSWLFNCFDLQYALYCILSPEEKVNNYYAAFKSVLLEAGECVLPAVLVVFPAGLTTLVLSVAFFSCLLPCRQLHL
jgi:hypothetical protein